MDGGYLEGGQVFVVDGLERKAQGRGTEIEVLSQISPGLLLVADLIVSSSFDDGVEEQQQVNCLCAGSGFWVEVRSSLFVVCSKLRDEFAILGGGVEGGIVN